MSKRIYRNIIIEHPLYPFESDREIIDVTSCCTSKVKVVFLYFYFFNHQTDKELCESWSWPFQYLNLHFTSLNSNLISDKHCKLNKTHGSYWYRVLFSIWNHRKYLWQILYKNCGLSSGFSFQLDFNIVFKILAVQRSFQIWTVKFLLWTPFS